MASIVQDAGRSGSLNPRLLFTIMIFVFMAIVLISIAGAADDSDAGSAFTVDGISYETTSDSEVKVINDSYTGDVIIPSSVENGGKTYSVTSIGDSAFEGCTSLSSVTIPNSVTSIGDIAFYECTTLSSVTIPDSVTSLGRYAFNGCTSLSSVIIGNSVTSIGDCVFYGCTAMSTVIIGNSVTSIGSMAFDRCTSLSSVTIPDSVTSIGGSVFAVCTSLESVTIPDSVTSIGNSAFYGCTSLSSVTIPDSVTSFGDGVFYGCGSLESVIIGNSVTSIGDHAFYGCTSLSSVTIPDSVTSISNSAFSACTSLESVTIPDSVTSIGDYAFYGCRSLASVTIPDSVTSFGDLAFCECTALSSVTIPDSVTSIGIGAFCRCTSLSSVTIPDSVTSIGDSAFYECTTLLSVTIPDSVTSIGDSVFYECTTLSSVTIPDSVTSICDFAFCRCTSLSSVTIPDSVTSIGIGAFGGCTSLISISVSSGNANYSSENGVFFNKTKTELIQYPAGKSGAYTIPDSVTYISYAAFYRCTSLSTVTIPDSVISLDDHAFYECTALTSITVESDTPFSIGSIAFPETSTIFVPKGSVEQYRAQWSEYSSQITAVLIASFETNVGTSIDPQNVLYGETAVRPADPIKTGYTLENWYTDTELTAIFSFDTPLYDDVTLYAKWTINQYTISFDTDGGSYVDPITQDYGTALSAPDNPTKTGYTFVKWTLDGEDYTFSTMPAQDITLKAVWQINRYAILFDTDGGSSVDPITQDYGTAVSAPGKPVKTEHIFVKWTLDGKDYTFTTMPAQDITLKAVWQINRYAAVFMNEGEVFSSNEYDYNSVIQQPSGIPSKKSTSSCDYKFTSWSGFTAGMVITGDIVFDAVYTGTIKTVDASGDKVVIDTKDAEDVKASSDVIEQIKAAGNSGKGTEITLSKGKISLDGASAAGLPSGAADISLGEADTSKIPSAIKDKIGDRPVYSISFGDIHEFNGTLTISVEYDLKDGEKAEDVCIWYLKNDGTYERISAEYSNGYVTFKTNHLSEYAVMVDPQPVPSGNGSNNIGLIIGGAVAGIVAIAAVAFIVVKRRQ